LEKRAEQLLPESKERWGEVEGVEDSGEKRPKQYMHM
jgi:hypothetical protein